MLLIRRLIRLGRRLVFDRWVVVVVVTEVKKVKS